MSASLLRPVTASASTGSTSRKIQNPSRIYTKRLDFFREFGCRSPISRIAGRRIQVAMKGSIGNRVNASEEGVNSLEQEALVQDSLSAGASGLEATINKLINEICISTRQSPGAQDQQLDCGANMMDPMSGGSNVNNDPNLASKQRIRWTHELHERFVDAVAHLDSFHPFLGKDITSQFLHCWVDGPVKLIGETAAI